MDFPLVDPVAELAVVGCAVDNARGALLARDRLRVEDFADGVLGRLFVATWSMDDVHHSIGDSGWPDERIRTAARLAEVKETDVLKMVSNRPVMSDSSGSYARRVLEAAQRRRLLVALQEAERHLTSGEPIPDLVLLLASVVEEAADPCAVGDRLRMACDTVRELDWRPERWVA